MTTYYVRTIADEFSYDLVNDLGIPIHGFSKNSHFETYYEPDLFFDPESVDVRPWGMRVNRMFNNEDQILYSYFALSQIDQNYRLGPINQNNISSTTIFKQSGTQGFIYWSNLGPLWFTGRWVQVGWANPYLNFNDWVDELCISFNTANIDSFTSNSENINLVIFKYKFDTVINPIWPTSEADSFLFVPVFYEGNDPNYDFTVVI
jgi:hypothetical protein